MTPPKRPAGRPRKAGGHGQDSRVISYRAGEAEAKALAVVRSRVGGETDNDTARRALLYLAKVLSGDVR